MSVVFRFRVLSNLLTDFFILRYSLLSEQRDGGT
jgi:hypothetical protein